MRTIQQAMLEEIYSNATKISLDNRQFIGEKNDHYITLEQLERILKEFEG